MNKKSWMTQAAVHVALFQLRSICYREMQTHISNLYYDLGAYLILQELQITPQFHAKLGHSNLKTSLASAGG